ncbi:MAG: D-alanyl-D-alanine carboxypeptidase/D-alanyl-D-alanine-endopeptidase [Polyangiaceae bacterium]|nr:D-alanyl-D-alanine carboxypeptidase/D-alanyl-D-alanine-endopeptidase [Polyangiaceae bacterium]
MRRHRLFFISLVIGAVMLPEVGARSEGSQRSAVAPARAPEIEAAVRALVNDRSFKDAQVGVSVVDAETGAVLAQSGEHLVLNPASNAKLYTAAAALAILHGSHRYQTTLSGTIKSGSVAELVLRGHGDPSLRSSDLFAMAEELKAHGVRRVDSIVVDQRFFDEQTTPPAFEQQPNEWAAFRAPVSAVALNENTITLTLRPTQTGSPATASFDPPGFVDAEGTVKTVESGADTVGLELSPAGKRMSAKISGAVAVDAKFVRYTRRVDDPQLFAGYALKAVLQEIGVNVGSDPKLATSPTAKAAVIVRHESEPLSTLLYALGKNSDNFYAEMIFKSLGAEAKTRPGRSQDAADIVTKWLERNDLSDAGVVIKNGSGLFDANRATANSMTKLLAYAWQDPTLRAEYVAQLSIGGVDGTLHKRFREYRGRRAIRAKTGTLDDAIALSGYVLGPPGKSPLAFSIMFNKVSGKAASARAAADRLATLLYERQFK